MELTRKMIVSISALNRLYYYSVLFELNDSDSEDSESENEGRIVTEMNAVKLQPRKRRLPRCTMCYESVIPRYSAKEFQMNFRMSPEAFDALFNQILPILTRESATGRPLKNPRKQLLAVICILATPDSYR